MNETHMVVRLVYDDDDESYSHDIVSYAKDEEEALTIVRSSTGDVGDFLVPCDICHASDLQKQARDIFVVDNNGLTVKAPNVFDQLKWPLISSGVSWFDAWDGERAFLFPISIECAVRCCVDKSIILKSATECVAPYFYIMSGFLKQAVNDIGAYKSAKDISAFIDKLTESKKLLRMSDPFNQKAYWELCATEFFILAHFGTVNKQMLGDLINVLSCVSSMLDESREYDDHCGITIRKNISLKTLLTSAANARVM